MLSFTGIKSSTEFVSNQCGLLINKIRMKQTAFYRLLLFGVFIQPKQAYSQPKTFNRNI
jgi:hypothetical protein